jgi:RNA polymerase sigma-70 factor (ECF subfamily)
MSHRAYRRSNRAGLVQSGNRRIAEPDPTLPTLDRSIGDATGARLGAPRTVRESGNLHSERVRDSSRRTRKSTRSAQQDTECELLQRLLADQPEAWREFDQRYTRIIRRVIHRVTAPFAAVGPEDLREIEAMLWVQLLSNNKRKLRGFEPGRGASLSTWIGMLTTHCAYDYLRVLRREPNRIALCDAERMGSPLPDPSEQYSVRQIAEQLSVALQGFSDKDREFVHLYFAQGLEPEQVADRMGISVKTVYSKKHKIRLRLESFIGRRAMAA